MSKKRDIQAIFGQNNKKSGVFDKVYQTPCIVGNFMIQCIMSINVFTRVRVNEDSIVSCRSKTDTERQNLGHIVEKRIKNFGDRSARR